MGLFFSRNRKLTLGIVAALTAAIVVRRRRRSRTSKSKAKKSNPNQRVWDIIWPKRVTDQGSLELISLAALNIAALWAIIRTTRGVTYVDGLLFSKDRKYIYIHSLVKEMKFIMPPTFSYPLSFFSSLFFFVLQDQRGEKDFSF